MCTTETSAEHKMKAKELELGDGSKSPLKILRYCNY